jgi:hypothetical protein
MLTRNAKKPARTQAMVDAEKTMSVREIRGMRIYLVLVMG